jgi:hypothetical protein
MTKKFPLRTAFLEFLESHREFDLVECYRHLFSSMEAGALENTLVYLQYQMKYEDWFFSFHKSMRQTDFFGDIYVAYRENQQTEEDLQKLKELREILPTYKGKIWEGIIIREEARSLGLDAEIKEYDHLRKKSKIEKRRSVSGNLDMVIWNLVHLDKENILQKLIERFFKQLDEQKEWQ